MDSLTQGPGAYALPVLAGLAAGATPGGARGISGLSNVLALQEQARERQRLVGRETRLAELLTGATTPRAQPPRLEAGFAAAPIPPEGVEPEVERVRLSALGMPAVEVVPPEQPLPPTRLVPQPPRAPLEEPGGYQALVGNLAASGFGPEAASFAARGLLARQEQEARSLERRAEAAERRRLEREKAERPTIEKPGEQGLYQVDPLTGKARQIVAPGPKQTAPHYEKFVDAEGDMIVAVFTTAGKQATYNLGSARDPQAQQAILSKYRIALANRAQNKVTGNPTVDALSTVEARQQLEFLRDPEFISGVIPPQRAPTRPEEEQIQGMIQASEAEEEEFRRTGRIPGAGTPPQARPAPAGPVETLSRRDPRYVAARQRGLTDQQIQQQFGLRLVD